jgi:hypothetical protein
MLNVYIVDLGDGTVVLSVPEMSFQEQVKVQDVGRTIQDLHDYYIGMLDCDAAGLVMSQSPQPRRTPKVEIDLSGPAPF